MDAKGRVLWCRNGLLQSVTAQTCRPPLQLAELKVQLLIVRMERYVVHDDRFNCL